MKNCPPQRRKKAAFLKKYPNPDLDAITNLFLKDLTWLMKCGEKEDISNLTPEERRAFGIGSNFQVPAVSWNKNTKNIASLLGGPQMSSYTRPELQSQFQTDLQKIIHPCGFKAWQGEQPCLESFEWGHGQWITRNRERNDSIPLAERRNSNED